MTPDFAELLLNDCRLILCKKKVPDLVPVTYDPGRNGFQCKFQETFFDHIVWVYAAVKLNQITTAGSHILIMYKS